MERMFRAEKYTRANNSFLFFFLFECDRGSTSKKQMKHGEMKEKQGSHVSSTRKEANSKITRELQIIKNEFMLLIQ
jgi:hypothetical protein